MASDIFDDVEDILNEADGQVEDKNFNETELQDIMSEIEDLEKEFTEIENSPEMSLQEKIDAELAMELEEINNVEISEPEDAEVVEEIAAMMDQMKKEAQPAPTPIVKQPVVVKAPVTKSEVAFEARGPMALNLDFKIGEESAKLVIDPIKGLMVTLSGVEIWINEESGCTVSMENGMKFTIPLSSQENSLKKKAA